MRTGLDVFLEHGCAALEGLRVGLCCNPTAVDRDFRHAIDRLIERGVRIERLFGPEHGVRATLQDMEHVHEHVDPVTGIPTVSLYGTTEASLHPDPGDLEDLDVVLFDIQDIGARFYTYQATLAFIMEVAGQVGTKVIVLDRPNPIGGHKVEGNVVQPGFHSFVGAYPLAVRHGMTMGELAGFFQRACGIDCEVEVVQVQGWRRDQWLDQTDAPWVYPSPNMPTLETATIYPGMCLFEGTNLSEGRGTTRPFHLFGAPWIDPQALAKACSEGAARYGLKGVRFRPAAFVPGFQKHTRKPCGGVEVHVVDREALDAFLLGLVTVEASYRVDPERFAWRTETYEYVDDPIAIDLLIGQADYRACVEAGGDLRDLFGAWAAQLQDFAAIREGCLLYA
ncbi:MAG: DUF1343 domain-containing protein [Deltaproteobacteria bacterium]|nr:MAG: DUF1343 domain-containing protein [Deltaproteobacteria bacterium]